MKAVAFAWTILILTVWACRGQGIDAFARYEDSLALAQKLERQRAVDDSIALYKTQIDTEPKWEKCSLTQRDSAVVDSLKKQIKILDFQINSCKKLRGLGDVVTQVSALRFYFSKNVLPLYDTQNYSYLIKNRIEIELQGTQYLQQRLCGKEKMMATAHIRKLQDDIIVVEKFIYAICNVRDTVIVSGMRNNF
jgi:hypothetical protein